jgi:stage II sporulation protein D
MPASCSAALLLLCALPLAAAEPTIKLRVHTPHGESTVEVPLERYVAAVLAGEGGVLRSDAARKALAVAARTYAVRLRGRHSAEGFDFCDTTHCQRADLDAVTPAIAATVAQTSGELVWFQGAPAFTPYSRDCGGRTEDAGELWPDQTAPYLRSQPDPYCLRAGSRPWQWSVDPMQVTAALLRSGLRAPRVLDRVEIVQRTPSGRARTLSLTGAGDAVRISAGSFHAAVGRDLGWNTVQSERYEVRSAGGRLVFQGSGSGHGVGLCQRGADQMGVEGRDYREILAFYYPGTAAGATARAISWQRLGGASVALLTTQPDRDGAVLALAERLAATLARRTGWPVPASIEIRVYPTVDAFRNATGEPGWVAAHTEGRRIHLQPAQSLRARDALEPVLRHELIHALMEAQAAPDLPVWFREGLAGYLEHPAAGGAGSPTPPDSALRQTADAEQARRAYAESVAAVTRLVNRYGESTVLGWVRSGLPSDWNRDRRERPDEEWQPHA